MLHRPRPLDDVLARHRAREGFTLFAHATFAAVALALGARPRQVRGAVLKHGFLIASAGMGFGVSPRYPLVFTTVVLVLGAVVLAAGYLPARRATKLQPLEALRGD